MIPKINISGKIEQISKPWSPIEVARVNDQVVRMALFDGEYPWHRHATEDELFYVYRGSIIIKAKGHPTITLYEGEMVGWPEV